MSRVLNGVSNFQMNSRVRADGMSANDLQRKLNRIVPPQPVPQPLPFAPPQPVPQPLPFAPPQPVPQPLSVTPPQPVPQPLPVAPPQPVPQPPPFAGQGAFTSMDPNQNGPVGGAGEYMLAMSGTNMVHRPNPNLFFQQNDPAFSQEQAKLQSAFDERFDEMPAGPALTAKAPQQQMAGGYGLTGSYQGDQFSRGVMSLPQIQDNFYSPPAGGYTAPPITSPYSMF